MRRKNISRFLVGSVLVLSATLAYAGRPWWVNHRLHQSFPNSYIKVISNSSSLSEEEAAVKEFEYELERQGMNKKEAAVILGHEQNFDVLDSYTEYGTTYWLVQYPNLNRLGSPRDVLEPIRFTPWAFVPGAAQIHKGQVGKGVGILAAEVAFIGGIIGTQCVLPSLEYNISTTHNVKLKKQYADQAQLCRTVSYICIGGAVAVYVWSLIDGCVSRGHKYRVWDGRSPYRAHLELAPSRLDQGNLALVLKF
ncbi:MAG: hypothetical protein NC048_10300 [Bacteroides sp.]|nr:hypothetical protein [Bacteroides sp.]